jgi:hypothetical protein
MFLASVTCPPTLSFSEDSKYWNSSLWKFLPPSDIDVPFNTRIILSFLFPRIFFLTQYELKISQPEKNHAKLYGYTISVKIYIHIIFTSSFKIGKTKSASISRIISLFIYSQYIPNIANLLFLKNFVRWMLEYCERALIFWKKCRNIAHWMH